MSSSIAEIDAARVSFIACSRPTARSFLEACPNSEKSGHPVVFHKTQYAGDMPSKTRFMKSIMHILMLAMSNDPFIINGLISLVDEHIRYFGNPAIEHIISLFRSSNIADIQLASQITIEHIRLYGSASAKPILPYADYLANDFLHRILNANPHMYDSQKANYRIKICVLSASDAINMDGV